MAEAEPLYRRALAIDENSYGSDHPLVAIRLNNLGGLLEATNRLAEAEPLMRRVIAIFEKSLGPDHPNVATRLNNPAGLLQATNRLAEAELPMRRHLEIFLKFTRASGHPHPHLQAAFGNYARLLRRMGRSEEQIQATLHETAPEFYQEEQDPNSEDPDVLRAWNNHSFELRKGGLFAQAEPIDRRVVAATAKVLGETNLLTVHRRNNLVLDLGLLGRLAEAREQLRDNWEIKSEAFANITQRIGFLAYIIALIESRPNTPFLGQLKGFLTGPELPIADGVAVPWDIAYILVHLGSRLPEGSAEFLTALIAALNDRANVPALDRFAEWRNQSPIPLDVPWPSE